MQSDDYFPPEDSVIVQNDNYKTAVTICNYEKKIIPKLEMLDEHGMQIVIAVIDRELERMKNSDKANGYEMEIRKLLKIR